MTSSTDTSSRKPFPTCGRIAAIDFGSVRTGVAICDPDRILVSPLAVHQQSTPAKNEQFFLQLAREERVAGFIVGLPIHCDGGESQKSIEARAFARWLRRLTGVPTRLFDERFSTSQAKRRLQAAPLTRKKLKSRIDAVAAQVLLEAFLEIQQYTGEIPGEDVDAPAIGGDALD